MRHAIRSLAGLTLIVPMLPALAQPTGASAPASGSGTNPVTIPGGDPTWLVADVAIALLVGLIVGYALGAWRSAAKNRASHA